MLGQTFYHETIRNIVVGFGTIFNNIQLVRKDNAGKVQQTMKVPLAYGPRQKFLVRLADDADLSKAAAVTLPRIGFEITGLTYDPGRKLNRVQKFKKVKGDTTKTQQLDTQYMPVPYNVNFSNFIFLQNSQMMLYKLLNRFYHTFNQTTQSTMNDNADMGVKKDIPVILNSISYEDDYQGDFTTRRAIIYTMDFTCKFYLYGPVTSSKVIKTVQVDAYTDLPDKSPTRQQRLTVTPNPTSADADDDFGFNEVTSFFEDAKNYNAVTGEDE